MVKPIRIGALISGSGTNLKAIIDACNEGRIDGELVFVGADTPDPAGFRWAMEKQIPTFHVNYSDIIRQYRKNPKQVAMPGDQNLESILSRQKIFPSTAPADQVRSFFITRIIAETQLLSRMTAYPFDLLILAGFMRNLTPYFIDSINTNPLHPRIMNIHPALLPAFPGIDGYGDTFRYGCKVGGCTVHFVDYGEDSGPIIAQKSFDIHSDDTLSMVRKRGLELESVLYHRCVQWFAEDRLRVEKSTHSLPGGHQRTRTVVRIL